MSTVIYVGNLPWAYCEDDLAHLFRRHGPVIATTVVRDRETGRSRGFGFVEMSDTSAARRAVAALNGADADGRRLEVNPARHRTGRLTKTPSA